jgi:YgiT-type zinc finger domain-containing protein
MKCVMCKTGNMQLGVTSVTLERDATTIVFKGVPAQVCQTCGESYISADVTRYL